MANRFTRNVILDGMCYFIPLEELRQTPKVAFHYLPVLLDEGIHSIHRVIHQPGAQSPSIAGREDLKPWYMHPHQEDNLLVLDGARVVDLYTVAHGKVERFYAYPDKLMHGDKVIFEGPHAFGWHQDVFHRPNSPNGSIALFFTRHFPGYSTESEFDIYDLNEETGEYKVLREGHLDQPNMMAE